MNSDYSDYKNVESIPAGACHRFVFCGNIVEGGHENGGEMCNECIDQVRNSGRGHDIPEQLDEEGREMVVV